MGECKSQGVSQKIRAAFFIDGFNLYHAIDDLGMPHLKWLSYWKLAQAVIPRKSQELVGVTWCTARHASDQHKGRRHDQMVQLQALEGVTVRKGHFISERRTCRHCGCTWDHPSEKEGDINVAISLMRGAFRDEYDHAYLLTADSDQVATLKMFSKEFPQKNLTVVVPPRRKRSEHLHRLAKGGSIKLGAAHLEKAVMPEIIIKDGVGSVRRPQEYAPPSDWVHPTDRPSKG